MNKYYLNQLLLNPRKLHEKWMKTAADLSEIRRLNVLDSEFVTNLMVAKLPGEIIKMKYIKYKRVWIGEHSSFEILDSFLVKEWENQRALKMLTSVDIASKSGDKKCFSCGKTNHLSNLCPVTNKKSKKGSLLLMPVLKCQSPVPLAMDSTHFPQSRE